MKYFCAVYNMYKTLAKTVLKKVRIYRAHFRVEKPATYSKTQSHSSKSETYNFYALDLLLVRETQMCLQFFVWLTWPSQAKSIYLVAFWWSFAFHLRSYEHNYALSVRLER